MKPILETKNLCKSFGSYYANKNINLKINEGTIHSIVGENGAGKSTLLKMLFGIYKPTSGEIYLRGQNVTWSSPIEAIHSGLGMVQQHFCLVDSMTALDNIILGAEPISYLKTLDRQKAIEKLKESLVDKYLAVSWDKKIEELSVGEKQRIEILKLLYRDSKILFLDEPTAVLTPYEISEFFDVLRKLKDLGRTIVIITHKINEIFELCDEYTILKSGESVTSGRVKDATPELIVEKMIGRELDKHVAVRTHTSPTLCLETRNLCDDEMHPMFKEVSLNIHSSEIVGLAGVEGSGQGQFVGALIGQRGYRGELKILSEDVAPFESKKVRKLGMGIVPSDRKTEGLWGEESCFNNLILGFEDQFSHYGFIDKTKIHNDTSKWAREFDVRADSLNMPCHLLSGGNQQKLLFSRELVGRSPKLLVCCHPTRGVDLGAIDLIHKKIIEARNGGAGVLLFSNDLDELIKMSDRIYVFFKGNVTGEFIRPHLDKLEIGAAMTGVKEK